MSARKESPHAVDSTSNTAIKTTDQRQDMTVQDAREDPRPLWEQMVLQEHKQAASMVGMKVGDWEAQRQLEMALQASEALRSPVPTIDEQHDQRGVNYHLEQKAEECSNQEEVQLDEDDGGNDGDDDDADMIVGLDGECIFADNPNAPPADLFTQFVLPVDVVRRILIYLDPDSIGYTTMVSPSWSIRPDDAVFRMLCERVYTTQSKKKLLRIDRWPSWRHMFLHRPRVRTNGMYVLRTWYLKRPHLDMWSQLPPGSVLEVVYFRYFKFYDDGTVLYSLNHASPEQMMRVLSTVQLEGEEPIEISDQTELAAQMQPTQPSQQRRNAGGRQSRHHQPPAKSEARAVATTAGSQIFVGRFTISHRVLEVTVHTHYAKIGFQLELVHGACGHFSVMRLLSHTSTSLSDPRNQPIPHKVPSDLFYFKRDSATYLSQYQRYYVPNESRIV